MSLIDTIRADALSARKQRLSAEASLLTTLTGEAVMVGKNAGNRETTDDEVRTVVRKFLKNIGETLQVITDPEAREVFEHERVVLQRYVPAELSETEIRSELALLGEVGPKDMGRVMGALNSKFPGRINGKMVGQILKG